MARSTHYHTQANISRFYTNPAEYNNSEEFFRMLMLVTVLQQDFGVRYNPRRIEEFDFQEPSDLFMHGLLGYGEGGTCVSIPTIYADVAQRLGYPVSLVYAKQHLFCRWDGPNARFNIEGTNHGMNSCPDEHYLTWPKPIAEVEVAAGQYLKTMSKRECLAAFLAIRAHCLEDNGMVVGASRAYDWAISLAPRQEQYRQFRNQLVNSTAMVFLPAPGASDRSVILRSGSPYIVPGGSQVITAADIMRLSLQKHPY